MRKYLLSVIIIFSSLSANAQSESDSLVSLAKVNFVGMTEVPQWSSFADQPDEIVEIVDDGLAITNTNMQSQSWQPQVVVVPDGNFDLEEGHDYIVRLTIKVPSDGTYMVNMGSYQNAPNVCHVPVEGGDDFQIIDVEYPEYKYSVVEADAHVVLGLGWVVGTTIIKEVEVFERKGYWRNDVFFELTSDTLSNYKYVQAMDDESLKTLNDLLAGKRITDDEAIIKFEDNKFFVFNDYLLPEGDYYTSDIYKMKDFYKDEMHTVYILPRIIVSLKDGFKMDDIMEQLGNRLMPIEFDNNPHYLYCNAKTSEEVLETIHVLNGLYKSGKYGIYHYSPLTYYLPVHPNDLPDIYDLDPFNENGIRLIYEKDWTNEWYFDICDGEEPDWSYEPTNEGLAMINPKVREHWDFDMVTFITDGNISFEKGHDYIVRLTIKVPSDGRYWMLLGRLINGLRCEVPVTASDDFQVIDIDFPDFVGDIWGDGYVILCNGWVAGTTVLKKIQVYEKQKGSETAIKPVKTVNNDDTIYNLSGQKVTSSYKGLVIMKGRKIVK